MSRLIKGVRSLGGGRYLARTTIIKDGIKKVAEKRFSSGTADQNRTSAQDWVQHWERTRAGLGRSVNTPAHLGGLVESYLEMTRDHVKPVTLGGYEKMLSQVTSSFGSSHPFYFNQFEIDEYVRSRLLAGAGRSIIKELSVLRYVLSAHNIVSDWSIPKHLYRIPKKQKHVPTIEEYQHIMQAATPECSLAASMALLAGLRDAEVPRIGWECYSPSEGILSVPAAIRKNKVGNVVPVVSLLGNSLDSYKTRKDESGTIILCPSSVRKELSKISGRKINGLQPFRRLLVETALDCGYDHDSVALITGHSRNSMVSRYSDSTGQLHLKRMILEDVERRLVV